MGLKLITAPLDYPVTLEQVKEHLRVVDDDEDAKLNLLIAAATAYVDGAGGFLGRALIDQTWELVLDEFPEGEIEIPLPPLIEVVSVKNGGEAVDGGSYVVDTASEPGRIVPVSSWPSGSGDTGSVVIRFRAGFLNTASPPVANVPENIKQAILILIAEMYEQRGVTVIGTIVSKLPFAAEALLRRSRKDLSMA